MVRFTVCGARYKTRPGLTYHLSHFHSGGDEEEDHGGAAVITPSPKHQGDVPTTVGVTTNSAGDIVDGRHLFLPLHRYSIVDLLNYTFPCSHLHRIRSVLLQLIVFTYANILTSVLNIKTVQLECLYLRPVNTWQEAFREELFSFLKQSYF